MRKLLVLGLGLLVLSTACNGGGAATLTSEEIVSLVPQAARDQGSFRMTMESVTTSAQQQEGQDFELRFDVEGAMDVTNERGSMTMSFVLPEGFPSAGGDSSCDMVFEGETGYLSVPEAQRAAFGGMPWVSGRMPGLGVTGSASASSPDQFLELIGGLESLERQGTEDVRGVSTTHYRGTLGREKLIEQALAAVSEEQREQTQQAMESFLPEGIPFELWLDDDALVRRLRMELQLGGGEGAGFSATSVTTVEFFDYGDPVSVEIPPADSVRQMEDLQTAMGVCLGAGPGL